MKPSKIVSQTKLFDVIDDGSILSVPGFSTQGVVSGIKPSGNHDLAMVKTDRPVHAAGVFTRNMLPAAPVIICRNTLERDPRTQVIVINSGNANALTGEQGMADALEMQKLASIGSEVPALVMSTGVIGVPLEMKKIAEGIAKARATLGQTPDHGQAFAEAITTTDSCTKTCAVRVTLAPHGSDPELTITVGGTAKGSGMIHPNMATMLAFIGTDAEIDPAIMKPLLKRAVDKSFHQISVDGDTSTNDTVLLLAGGQKMTQLTSDDPRLPQLEAAVAEVAHTLALQIVYDGEGRTRLMELRVKGADSNEAATKIARTVVTSSLVKTALAGGDPNWGRIIAAAANAGVAIDLKTVSLVIQGIPVFEKGKPLTVDRDRLTTAVAEEFVQYDLTIGTGEHETRMFTTDLTKEYVHINSEYTT